MAGLAKGMATTSSWTLVRCDCTIIVGTGYIKSANDESLARDEGSGRNLFMEVATYKPVQGCQLRMTPATATLFFQSVDAAVRTAQDHRAPKGSTCEPTTFKHGGVVDLQAVKPCALDASDLAENRSAH